MIKSIKHFAEESISIFEKLEEDFFKHPEKMAEYVRGITKELHRVGILIVIQQIIWRRFRQFIRRQVQVLTV